MDPLVAVVIAAGASVTGGGTPTALPAAATVEVLEDAGDTLRVRLGRPVPHACVPSPDLPVEVELSVPAAALAPVLERQWERIWPDSSQIWVAPGAPTEVVDGVPTTRVWPFDPAVPLLGGRVGTRFTPFPAPTGLTDGRLGPGARLAFGPSLVLAVTAEVASVELGAREGVYTPCARLVGVTRDPVGPPLVADPPASPDPVAVVDPLPAGTLLRWPDGRPAGRTRVPLARARFGDAAHACADGLVPGLVVCVDPALLPPPPPPPAPPAPEGRKGRR